MEEIWRDVKDYEGFYQVSNLGRVRSIPRILSDNRCKRIFKGRILSPGLQSNNYLGVWLYKNGKSKSVLIHHLVTETFIGERPYLHDVDHKDRNHLNNTLDNLNYKAISLNRGEHRKTLK